VDALGSKRDYLPLPSDVDKVPQLGFINFILREHMRTTTNFFF
jgi:hypothetical protein